MSSSDVEALRAFDGAVRDFLTYAATEVARANQSELPPADLFSRGGTSLHAIRGKRVRALLAGLHAGKSEEEMAEILDFCIAACTGYLRLSEASRIRAYQELEDNLIPRLEMLEALTATFAGRATVGNPAAANPASQNRSQPRPGAKKVELAAQKGGESDDPTSLKTMHRAALQCLSCCESLFALASTSGHRWHLAHREGELQTLANSLTKAIEDGKGIEHEAKLIFGPERTFGDVVGRNAHMAALLLARNINGLVETLATAGSSPAAENIRGELWHLSRGSLQADRSNPAGFSYGPRYAFAAWREAIESEAARAARIALPQVVKTSEKGRKKTKKKTKPAKQPISYPVELRGRGEPPVVRGKAKNGPLTKAQYDVVGSLVAAGEQGLTKDRLIELSNHSDALGILRRLANGDSDWHAVIKFPGKPGVRYRIS